MPERGMVQFAEGQWYDGADGSAVRIDRVSDGWVYFVAWLPDDDIGVPKRMMVATFAAAMRAAGMLLYIEP